jgi:transcriptional regulator with XRE-family HTH domain
MKQSFSDWLLNELQSREMSQADLARLSGVTTAQISRIISGGRKPGDVALNGIARAFKMPPEKIFELAGLLPPGSSTDKDLSPIKRALLKVAEDLPDSDVQLALSLLEQRKEFYKKNPQAKPSK